MPMDPSNVFRPAARCWALFADATYGEQQITVRSGDRLILFTDGITEVRPAGTTADDPGHDEFGEESLIAHAIEHRACSAPALQARLTAAVADVRGGHVSGRCDADDCGDRLNPTRDE